MQKAWFSLVIALLLGACGVAESPNPGPGGSPPSDGGSKPSGPYLSALPATAVYGDDVAVVWHVPGATRCALSSERGHRLASGTQTHEETVKAYVTGTWRLECELEDGSQKVLETHVDVRLGIDALKVELYSGGVWFDVKIRGPAFDITCTFQSSAGDDMSFDRPTPPKFSVRQGQGVVEYLLECSHDLLLPLSWTGFVYHGDVVDRTLVGVLAEHPLKAVNGTIHLKHVEDLVITGLEQADVIACDVDAATKSARFNDLEWLDELSSLILCKRLERLELPKLSRVSDLVLVNSGLTRAHFPALSSVGSFRLSNNPQLGDVDFSALRSAQQVQVQSDGMHGVLNLPNLETLPGSLDLRQSPGLEGVSVPKLTSAAAIVASELETLASLELPNVAEVSGDLLVIKTHLRGLAIPRLHVMPGARLAITGNACLPQADAEAFAEGIGLTREEVVQDNGASAPCP